MNKTVLTSFLVLCLLSTLFLMGFQISVKGNSEFSVHNIDTGLDYVTIQGAINANETLDGHTILVDAGAYYENVVVNKTLSLIGENRNTTIIDGNLTGYVVWVKANKVTIKGFTIRRSGTYNGVSLGVFLDHSNSSKINANMIATNGDGILLVYACNNSINGNIIRDNGRGIRLHHYCNNNSLYENTIINNYDGIYIFGNSEGNRVIRNMIEGKGKQHPYRGIEISDYCRYNVINGNTITSNEEGIEVMFSSEHNVFNENTITENIKCIRLHVSNCNNIYHNNFINYTVHVSAYRSYNNNWDYGYPSGGNYWTDYTGLDEYSGVFQNDTGNDWIGDTPYVIDGNNQDNYPFTDLYVPERQEILVAYRNLLGRYNQILSDFNILNSTYHTLLSNFSELQGNYTSLQISYNSLQGLCDSLNSTYTNLMGELNNIRNLMYIFIATTIILIATTIYLAIRKPKIKP